MKNIKYYILALGILILSGCDPWEDVKNMDGDRNKNLYELLSANPDLSTFVKVLQTTGYDEVLSSDMSYTVFAPTNSALVNIDLNDTEALKAMVQNYISMKIAYTDNLGAFELDSILMLNGKVVRINGKLISGTTVSKWNISSKNGVLHIIDGTIIERMNIWQYLQTLSDNPVVEFISSFTERVMDMDRSIQTGVNESGKPTYDTVWTYKNSLLDASPLIDESKTSTYILLNQAGLDALKTKYAKYFAQKDSVQMQKDILKEIVSDMILPYTEILADGRYPNLNQVMVDVNLEDIATSYAASNGLVYVMNTADVKMYENKIKALIVEGEDFIAKWPDAWQVRPRTWASGGYDVMLKSRTRHSYDWVVDTITTKINNYYSYNYRSENEWPGSNTLGEPNAYISYKPKMYSTPYKIYWKAYDDNSEEYHIDSREMPMLFYQKMYISFPSEKVLERNSSNVIVGNFSSTTKAGFTANHTIMAAKMRAGENVETQLMRYRVNQGHTVYPNSYVLYDLESPNEPRSITSEDIYGKEGILKCPYYGQSTIFVSNTCLGEFTHFDGSVQPYLQSSKSANAPGMIFIDYIRLEPQVDPND